MNRKQAMRPKVPNLLGSPSEDLITFKDKFKREAEDNWISKTGQLKKRREALTGNAAFYIPLDGVVSVDDTWKILEKAIGNPLTQLYLRLGIMKSTKPLTDKVVETYTSRAVAWFLN